MSAGRLSGRDVDVGRPVRHTILDDRAGQPPVVREVKLGLDVGGGGFAVGQPDGVAFGQFAGPSFGPWVFSSRNETAPALSLARRGGWVNEAG